MEYKTPFLKREVGYFVFNELMKAEEAWHEKIFFLFGFGIPAFNRFLRWWWK
jgi:hypothetical protein